jgi:hypothetical protein
MNKTNIAKIGVGGGKQFSGIYRSGNLLNHNFNEFVNFIDYNYISANQNNLKVNNNFFLEHRDYHQSIDDQPFFGKFHMDQMEDTFKSCYTFIYYYKISPTIIGGKLEFDNKEIYKPIEFDLICFDGDHKHKINKLSGEGIRGTLIMNIEKI